MLIGVVVRTQMLAELEEIILYKQIDLPERKESLREIWNQRLLGCQHKVEVWQGMLKVRALVLRPEENPTIWIKFANLCRKSDRTGLAERSLISLENVQETEVDPTGRPSVGYARLKFRWATGNKHKALKDLVKFTDEMSEKYQNFCVRTSQRNHHERLNGANGMEPPISDALRKQKDGEDSLKYQELLAKCYRRQGQWQAYLLRGDWTSNHTQNAVQDILRSYDAACQYNQSWYKAWHAYALANFEGRYVHGFSH